MTGSWITVEGIGGSGKTTIVRRLHDYLLHSKYKVIRTKEPGGTIAGRSLRRVVLTPRKAKLNPLTELMLYEADRHETYKKIVEPNINRGKIVLSDRGIDGSIAYQGFGRELSIELIDYLTSLATEKNKPDVTFLIDVNVEVGMERVIRRDCKEKDQFDLENVEFQKRVRDGFLFVAKRDPNRVFIIDGLRSQDDVLDEMVHILEQKVLKK